MDDILETQARVNVALMFLKHKNKNYGKRRCKDSLRLAGFSPEEITLLFKEEEI